MLLLQQRPLLRLLQLGPQKVWRQEPESSCYRGASCQQRCERWRGATCVGDVVWLWQRLTAPDSAASRGGGASGQRKLKRQHPHQRARPCSHPSPPVCLIAPQPPSQLLPLSPCLPYKQGGAERYGTVPGTGRRAEVRRCAQGLTSSSPLRRTDSGSAHGVCGCSTSSGGSELPERPSREQLRCEPRVGLLGWVGWKQMGQGW